MDAVTAAGLSGKSMEGKMIGKQIIVGFRRVGFVIATALLVCLPVSAQQPAAQPPAPVAGAAPQGPGLVPAGDASQMNINAGDANAAAAGAHPLEPALELAAKGLASIQANIHDYSCTMVKRERIDGKLGEHQYMFAKVRREPYSVYLYFLGPEDVKGQEVIYVDGKNDNNMLAHAGSGVRAMVGTVSLKPQSMLAMTGNRYPITEFGVERLAERLVEVAKHDKQFGECEVNFFPNAKVNGRICTCVQVVHPVPRRNFRFHLARVFIDDELLIPVRYEAYDWPHESGGQPVLMEEYTYMNVKTNQGFTDADFDPANPSYKFGGKK
jgi:outer membrane lipoprotein-sorting protein